jgi:hypothetical protein
MVGYSHRGRQAVWAPINDHVVSMWQCFQSWTHCHWNETSSRYNLGTRKLLLMLGHMQTWYFGACSVSCTLYYCHKDSRGSLDFPCGWKSDPKGGNRDDAAASGDLVEPIAPIISTGGTIGEPIGELLRVAAEAGCTVRALNNKIHIII